MDPNQCYYYQLRYDSHDLATFLSLTYDPSEDDISGNPTGFQFLNPQGYVYGKEYKQDGTKHLQMMFANEFELSQNEKTKIREAIKKKLNVDYRNPCSITTANYPHALLNYCQKVKESKSTFDQEYTDYLRSLPLNGKTDWKAKVNEYLVKLLKDQPNITKAAFYTRICGFYIENDRSLPRKQQLLTLAVKHKIIHYDTYLSDIGIIYYAEDDYDEEPYKGPPVAFQNSDTDEDEQITIDEYM